MDFAILGPLRVVDGDADIELGGPRQQRVLACLLAVHPEELSADQLVYEVWNEDPPETASHVLRTYLSGLRNALGGRITSDRHHYGVDTSADRVDAIEFVDLPVGASRHTVRFAILDGSIIALKELPLTLLLAPAGTSTLATELWDAAREAFYAQAAVPAADVRTAP